MVSTLPRRGRRAALLGLRPSAFLPSRPNRALRRRPGRVSPGTLLPALLFLATQLHAATSTDNLTASRTTLNFTVFGATINDTGSNVGATLEPEEVPVGGEATIPNPLAGSHSMWWTIEVDGSGPVEINTTGSDFDTILYVFTGTTYATLVAVVTNDDANGDTVNSRVLFQNTGTNQFYRVAVLGFEEGDTGNINLQIKTGPPLPSNNDLANRVDLDGRALPLTYPNNALYPTDPVTASNLGATLEATEPDSTGGGGASVWFRWRAPSTGWYQIDTLSSDFDTLLYVYKGTGYFNLVEDSANDDDHGETSQSRVVFEATSTTQEYRIALHGWAGSIGNVVLKIKSVAAPPLNDDFASAKSLPSVAVLNDTVDNTGASIESIDSDIIDLDPFGSSGASLWWKWVPPTAGLYQVNTFNTAFGTALYVYRVPAGISNPTYSNLIFIGGCDDAAGTTRSRVSFGAAGDGSTFYFEVHGEGGSMGPLRIDIAAGIPRPPGDLFTEAIDLDDTITNPLPSLDDTNLGAARQTDEPLPLNIGEASIWYSWTSPATPGRYRVDTAGSNFDTILYVFEDDSTTQSFGPYDNTTSGSLTVQPDLTTPLVRTFNVTHNFRIEDLNVGLNATHNWRGDLRVQLTSPEGTTVTLIAQSADFDDNYDLLLDSQSGGLVDDNTNDTTAAPIYGGDRTAAPSNPLSPFDGELATGTWTLSIGNTNFSTSGGRTLTFTSARLEFTGTTPGLTTLKTVAVDDHSGGTLQAGVDFDTAASTTYYFAVNGRRGQTGLVDLSLAPTASVPPANDLFASVSEAPILPAANLGNTANPPPIADFNTANASIEEQEQDDLERGGASVWYRWQAPAGSGTTRKSVSTLGSTYGTLVYVFEDFAGQIERINLVGFSNEAGGTNQGVAHFDAVAGQVYYIAVHGDYGQSGLLDLTLGAGIPAPVNDRYANDSGAVTATNLGTTATPAPVIGFSTAGASLEIEEPNPLGIGGASVWYNWTAPVGEEGNWFQIDTLGSNYDTVLHVFTGATADISGFVEVASGEDDAGNISQSRLNLQVTGGTTYHIAAHGFLGETGNLNLNITKLTAPPPPNDNPFDGAAVTAVDLGAVTLPLTGVSNERATLDPREEDPLGLGGRSLWYCWTQPAGPGAWYEFDTLGSTDPFEVAPNNALDTLVYAFENTNGTLAGLIPIDANDDNSGDSSVSRLNFFAQGGKTYYFAVHGYFGDLGDLSINLTPVSAPPANDDLANAIDLGAEATESTSGNNTGATLEGGELDPLDDAGASIWYCWTAPSGGLFAANTLGGASPIDTILYVFSSAVPSPGHDDLAFAGANDASNGTQQSTVNFQASAGTKYFFAVHGDEGVMGAISFNIGPGTPPPSNDAFATPSVLASAVPVSTAGTNAGATLQAGEPVPFGVGGASLWYQWQSPAAGTFTIDTLGSNFDTRLYVFQEGVTPAIADLVLVASDNNAPGLLASELKFAAASSTTYYIAVHGDEGDTGSLSLRIESTPANDDFAAPQILSGTTASATGTNRGATIEGAELVDYTVGGASIWYCWTAPTGGNFDVNTFGSSFDTRLYIYTGTGYPDLLLTAANDNAPGVLQSRLSLAASAGTTYWIAVHGNLGATGNVSLQLTNEGPFGVWIAQFPSLTGANALPLADPDKDGIRNLSELAFGLNPTLNSSLAGSDPNRMNAPQYVKTATHLQLFYTINPANLGGGAGSPIEVTGTWSTDLFNTVANNVTPVSLGGNAWKVETTIDSPGTPKKQLGVLVTDPNP